MKPIKKVIACWCMSMAAALVHAQDTPPPQTDILDMMDGVIGHVDAEAPAEGEGIPEAGATAEPLALTVRQCVEMALANNPQVLVAQDEVDAALARQGQARAPLFPQVKAQVGFTHIDEPYSGPGGVISRLGAVLAGEEDRRTDRLSMNQLLYAGGQVRAAMRASACLAEAQQWRRESVLDALEFKAKQGFYDCLLAHALVRVAQESVVTFERHRRDAEQMLAVGLVSEFEVLRARTELGARQADTVAARNAERLALANLRRILAVPQHTPLRLDGELAWQPVSFSCEQYVQQAYDQRAEIRALERAVAAAGEDVRRAKGQYKPHVAASAEWTNVDGGGAVLPEGWTLGVGVEWDLSTGGRRKHEVAEANAKLRGLEHQLDDVKGLVELDVRQALIQVEDAVARIRSEKGTLELAREGLRLAELRFHEGVGIQAETLDAELAQTKAETSLMEALRNYAVAHAALEKAVGTSWAPRDMYPRIAEGAPES